MTRKKSERQARMFAALHRIGIANDDATALRRISVTLRRWHELECGTEHGKIERNETTCRPFWRSSVNGRQWPVADRETGARKRLASLMTRYPALSAYIQGDPRGAALYILRPGDVPAGADADAYYSRGIAVY
jgi:hypothetical protein